MFAIAIPTAIAGAMEISLTPLTACIPMINFTMLTENLFQPLSNNGAILIAIFSNFMTSMLIIWFTLNMFSIQWKGSNETKGFDDILSPKRRATKKLIPAHAFLSFAFCFLGYTYGSLFSVSLKIDLFAYFLLPLIFCLGTVVLVVMYSKLDFATTFKWSGIDKNYTLRVLLSSLLSLAFNILIRDFESIGIFKIDFQTFSNQINFHPI